MIINLRKGLDFIRILVIFCLLTFFFYQILTWALEVLSPRYQYKRPHGNSVEVISVVESPSDQLTLRERLYYYWFHGE